MMRKILSKALEEISFEEKEEKLLEKLAKKICKEIQKRFPYGKVFLGGSLAKGTMIKKKEIDIDIFLIFEEKYKNRDISLLAKNCLKKMKKIKISDRGFNLEFNFEIQTLHGSRDYFMVSFPFNEKKVSLELVPVIKISKANQAINVTDISPLHVKYISKALSKKQKQEVKLLKAFVQAIGCYGAESYIRGFSGYSLELLIDYYGSFLKLCKKAVKWKPIVFIDKKKYYKSKKEALEKINKAKISPILLIDPVDKNRNALAALSEEAFSAFINACKKFLEKPSRDFFIKREKEFSEILNEYLRKSKKKRANLLNIEIFSSAKFDVAGAKSLKFFKALKLELEQNFHLIDAKFLFNKEDNKATLLFILKPKKEIIIEGPPLNLVNAVKAFKKKHKRTFIKKKDKEERIYAIEKPKTLKQIINKFLGEKENYKISKLRINYLRYFS